MDKIDAAIATLPQPEQRANIQVTLPTGRIALIGVPADLTLHENLALAGYVATGLPQRLGEVRSRPLSRLLVPS